MDNSTGSGGFGGVRAAFGRIPAKWPSKLLPSCRFWLRTLNQSRGTKKRFEIHYVWCKRTWPKGLGERSGRSFGYTNIGPKRAGFASGMGNLNFHFGTPNFNKKKRLSPGMGWGLTALLALWENIPECPPPIWALY